MKTNRYEVFGDRSDHNVLRFFSCLIAAMLLVLFAAQPGIAQNSTTGAITGLITDASGAAVPGVQVTATNDATGAMETASSNGQGTYIVPLLAPGNYHISATKTGFAVSTYEHIIVVVTETATVNVQLKIGSQTQKLTVTADQTQLQTQDAQLGIVTDSRTIEALPLVTRNFIQIAALEPGVSSPVTDASALGRGTLANEEASGGISSNGSDTNDNNFQINGVEVNDLMGAGPFTGGVPTPNPDTLEEFKVVTAPYDASNGRNSGAQVNVLTKGGTNQFHGNLYEFFRNEDLNANSWSNNRIGAARGVLRQNQYGGTLGGPIKKDKVLFFGSYQGTNQLNGIASGCSVTVLLPPLTDSDRTAAGLGALFAGQRGYFQTAVLPGGPIGPAIAADGSNINPVALAVLQAKLPNGQYIIPSPQKVTPTTLSPSNPLYAQAFSEEGQSVISQPCPFTEKQFEANVDYLATTKSQLMERFFFSNDSQTQTLFGTTLPGFPYPTVNTFRDFSLIYTYTFNSHLVNQAEAGFHRSTQAQAQQYPPAAMSYSQFGIALPPFSSQPKIEIADAVVGGYGQTYHFAQDNYILSDALTWTLGRHSIHFGGNVTKSQINEGNFQYAPPVVFETFADFLLGQNAAQNGTAAACVALGCSPGYSDVASSVYLGGDIDRAYRVLDGGAYVQDDFKVSRRLTINLGIRYDRIGQIGDASGHNVAFFPYLANPNPPAAGTLQGFVLPSNYKGPIPAGITQGTNDFGTLGYGQNQVDPRIGAAWLLPGTDRVVLRGGYGIFHSRSTAIALFQGISTPPFAIISQVSGTQTAAFTDANPFAPLTATLPAFQSYSPTTNNVYDGYAPNFRFPTVQRYSMDLQTKIASNFVLDLGYVGSKFTHETVIVQTNQAVLASVANPIRGVTTNTVGNIPLRVPIEGFNVNGIGLYEDAGHGMYNSLQVSLNKRFSHGLQFLASYTFARDLTNAIGTANAEEAGSFIGNQLAPAYGPDSFVRPHRFVLSYVYQLPGPKGNGFLAKVAGGWATSGVVTIQSGQLLTVTYTNRNNAYGETTDRPNYTPGCAINTSGGLESRLLNGYLNASCFSAPPPLVSGITATGFGDSPLGQVTGPGQFNFDIAILKRTALHWPTEGTNLEFRAEMFNAFNHPQFANPSTTFNTATFGIDTGGAQSTSPRIIQFALKLNF